MKVRTPCLIITNSRESVTFPVSKERKEEYATDNNRL